jgi:hypothetical protein
MTASGSANVYVFGATLEQRQKLAAAIKMLLTGLGLLREIVGDSGPRVEIKKSTHLYVVDDPVLSGELQPGEPIKTGQWLKARKQAAEVIAALDRLFAKPRPDLPPFLWPKLKPRFSRAAPGRIVSSGKPNHWFIGYELLMDGPDGRANGIRGAIMEFRLVPLAGGGWRLLLLHIRFPLLGTPLPAPLFRLKQTKPVKILGDKSEKADPTKSLTLPPSAGFGSLSLPAPKPATVQPEAEPAKAVASAGPPPIHYVMPVEGSNLLAPYYAFAGEGGEQYAPATAESAIILIERQRPGGLILLKAAVAPATGAPWAFAWHYAGMEKGRPNRPVQAMATGPILLLPEGLYDVDLLVTRTVRIGPPETGATATIVLRTRRMMSSAHAIVPVAEGEAETIVHSHGEREAAAPAGDEPPGHHHA